MGGPSARSGEQPPGRPHRWMATGRSGERSPPRPQNPAYRPTHHRPRPRTVDPCILRPRSPRPRILPSARSGRRAIDADTPPTFRSLMESGVAVRDRGTRWRSTLALCSRRPPRSGPRRPRRCAVRPYRRCTTAALRPLSSIFSAWPRCCRSGPAKADRPSPTHWCRVRWTPGRDGRPPERLSSTLHLQPGDTRPRLRAGHPFGIRRGGPRVHRRGAGRCGAVVDRLRRLRPARRSHLHGHRDQRPRPCP